MRRNGLLPLFLVAVIFALGIVAAPFLAQRIAYAVTNGQLDATRQHLTELSKQDTMSPLFRAVSTAVMPAVVEVRTSRKITVNPEEMPDLNDLLHRFFGDETPAPSPRRNNSPAPGRSQHELMMGLGSGVIVDAQNGYVLTNYHVVSNADTVEVITGDQRHFTT
jgi:S1-C subfamily serine protease